jgi:hypothetical protein
MPFPPRPVDSTLHGVVDYSAGALLLTVFPKAAGIEGTRSARQVRISAAIHAGYSALTDYPLGMIKLLPFRAHLALDALGAVALAATPLVTGQYKKGPKQWVPHVDAKRAPEHDPVAAPELEIMVPSSSHAVSPSPSTTASRPIPKR